MAQRSENKQINVRFPPDMTTEVERIKEQRNMKSSEVVRRLVAKGLQSDSRARHVSESFSQLAHTLGAVGIITAILSLFYQPVSVDQSAILFMTFLICGFASALLSLHYAPEAF